MTKKIFIGALVFFIIAVAFAVYLLFFRSAGPATPSGNSTADSGYQSFPVATTPTPTETSAPAASATSTPIEPTTIALQALTHLYASPIAGAGIVAAKSGESVRLTDRATGHMYLISLSTSTPGAITEISDKTLPKMYESLWLGASTTLLRYADANESTIKTYSVTLVPPGKTSSASSTPGLSTVTGTFLPDNIEQVVGNPSGSQIFYIIQDANGATGKIATANGGKVSTIFTSAIGDWNVGWPSASTISLSSKSASVARGYLYFLSTNGTMQRILGDVPGLASLVDPTTNLVAYSDNTLSLSIFNIKNNSTQTTSLSTLADKCAWSPLQKSVLYCAVPNSVPAGHYPESWYQGLVSFSDSIYRIETNTGQATRIADVSAQTNQAIDIENLMVSPKEDYLIFTNKADLSLWALQLQLVH